MRQQRRRQLRKPSIISGNSVLHQLHDELAACLLDAEISRQAVVESVGGDLDEPIGTAPDQVERTVGRSRIHRHDLVREAHALVRDGAEQRRQRLASIPRRNDNRDERLRHLAAPTGTRRSRTSS